MKKIIIIIATLAVIMTTGAIIGYNIKNKEKNTIEDKIIELTFDELNKKINNKDTFILIVSQTGCSHCKTYKEIVNNIINKYDVDFYDINLTNLSDEETSEFIKIVNSSGTPTTVFMFDGVEKTTLNRISGSSSEEKVVAKLKKLGFLE